MVVIVVHVWHVTGHASDTSCSSLLLPWTMILKSKLVHSPSRPKQDSLSTRPLHLGGPGVVLDVDVAEDVVLVVHVRQVAGQADFAASNSPTCSISIPGIWQRSPRPVHAGGSHESSHRCAELDDDEDVDVSVAVVVVVVSVVVVVVVVVGVVVVVVVLVVVVVSVTVVVVEVVVVIVVDVVDIVVEVVVTVFELVLLVVDVVVVVLRHVSLRRFLLKYRSNPLRTGSFPRRPLAANRKQLNPFPPLRLVLNVNPAQSAVRTHCLAHSSGLMHALRRHLLSRKRGPPRPCRSGRGSSKLNSGPPGHRIRAELVLDVDVVADEELVDVDVARFR